jgi:hypothetical protein
MAGNKKVKTTGHAQACGGDFSRPFRSKATEVASSRLFRHGQASADSVPSIEPPQSQIFHIDRATIELQATANQHMLLHWQHRLHLGDAEIFKLIVSPSNLRLSPCCSLWHVSCDMDSSTINLQSL